MTSKEFKENVETNLSTLKENQIKRYVHFMKIVMEWMGKSGPVVLYIFKIWITSYSELASTSGGNDIRRGRQKKGSRS